MALTITLVPNVSTYTLGDPPITVTMTTASGTTPDYMWESNNGVFTDKFANGTTFTPNNATKVTSIIGRNVNHTFSTNLANLTAIGAYGGRIKSSGSSAAWDAKATVANGLVGGTGFVEFETQEITTEKACGFLVNSNYNDPTLVGSNSFTLCWHLLANGTAIPRKQGIELSTPVVYKAGDLFRVTINALSVTYSINGVVMATTSVPAGALIATVSMKTLGATINNPSYFPDVSLSGSASLSVIGILPVQPNYSYDVTSDNNTISSEAEDGTMAFLKKGKLRKTLALQFNERPYSEYLTLIRFWEAHEKHNYFIYNDLVFSDIYLVRFESGFRSTISNPDTITMQVTLREV